MQVSYREGYKYQLALPYVGKVDLHIAEHISHSEYIVLSPMGDIIINAGYAWDGCSGPTWDDNTNARAGLVHDALYQLIREGLLPEDHRKFADEEFYRLCKADGMNALRAWFYFKAVRNFGAGAARAKNPIITAP